MSRVKKAVLFIIVVALAVFISAPIQASVDFDGKKVRIAAIKKIEPLGDNQLLFTMIDDVVVGFASPSCKGLETATKFSFLVEQSFYIRPGAVFVYWSLEDVGEQTCVIESFSRVPLTG